MSSTRRATARGPLQPVELATAAVLGAMTTVLVLAGTFIPHAGAVAGLGVVPMGVIAYFHRSRAVVAAVVASTVVGMIVAGTGVVYTVVLLGAIGGLAGRARARGWRAPSVLAGSLVLGPTLSAVADGLLWLFAPIRRLTFSQLLAAWKGFAKSIGRVVAQSSGQAAGQHVTRELVSVGTWAVSNWWGLLAFIGIVTTVAVTLFVWWGLEPILKRLERLRALDDRLAGTAGGSSGVPVAPLPASLRGVTVRYPGQANDALGPIDLDVAAGQFVVVLGPNGSGKSTLARVLAGVPPTGGTVSRPGAVGLGLDGGVAMIAQRPESQVLGVTVADDVLWGLPRGAGVDVAAALGEVGLAGLEVKETAGLSGGQLQRLAIAAALARKPALLVSDESTAMVDVDGRHNLLALLSRIPAERGMTVVHVTHRLSETEPADSVVRLEGGRIVGERLPPAAGVAGAAGVARTGVPGVRRVAQVPASAGPPKLRVVDVSHTYAEGTPWANVALRHVSLEVRSGEGVLVAGGNGSGKVDAGVGAGRASAAHVRLVRVERAAGHPAGRPRRPGVPARPLADPTLHGGPRRAVGGERQPGGGRSGPALGGVGSRRVVGPPG